MTIEENLIWFFSPLLASLLFGVWVSNLDKKYGAMYVLVGILLSAVVAVSAPTTLCAVQCSRFWGALVSSTVTYIPLLLLAIFLRRMARGQKNA